MKKIVNAFTVPMMEADISDSDNLNSTLVSNIYELFDTMDDKRLLSHEWNNMILTDTAGSTGYSSFNHGNLAEDPKFKFFYDAVTPLITDFFQQLEFGPDFPKDWKFENSWAAVYPKSAYVPHHSHGDVHWSGVYYVKTPEKCGNLIFFDPKEYALSNEPSDTKWRGNRRSEILVEAGKLIVWPGYLKHESMPNQSDEDRIIISFNINCF